jgi:phage-related minor tail protein
MDSVSESGVVVFDPSDRTTRTFLREIENLRHILEARMEGNRAEILAKLELKCSAVERLHEMVDAFPSARDHEIARERTLTTEQLAGIQRQLDDRVVYTKEKAGDVEKALAAALQAAKEAVSEQNKAFALATSKSEAAVMKQIDQQAVAIQSTYGALEQRIADVRERLTHIESTGKGRDNGVQIIWALILGMFVIAGSAATILAVIFHFSVK